jgi:exodeoxyribonuclease V beta subunit
MKTAFDMETTPLGLGVTLLEASAGTGKTYTIEGLFLRLVAERGLPVREILVCTFTNAATEELRSRIRERLRRAREELRSGEVADPAAKAALAAVGDALTVRVRLAQALAGFDEAGIYTIHGFCNRVLSEHAFESGGAFGRTVAEDSAVVAAQAARDFVRRVSMKYPFLALALHMGGADVVGDCSAALGKRGADRDVEVRLCPEAYADMEMPEAQLGKLAKAVRDAWQREAAELMAFIRDESRVKVDLRNAAGLIELGIGGHAEGGPLSAEFFAALETLCPGKVEAQLKKKVLMPEFALFGLCEELLQAFDRARATLIGTFLSQADSLMAEAREIKGTMSSDDLLYETAQALRSDGPGSLVRILKGRYRVALVDEFQDTDRIQWEIFRTLFADSAHSLFIIGDPKQSIYRFRGADVHAYLDAAATAGVSCTLGTNWRSDAPLVEAVNTLFTATGAPFGEGIDFLPAAASGRDDAGRAFASSQGLPPEPMRFVFSDSGMRDTAASRERWLMAQLCHDVRELLDGGATVGGRPVSGGDIAVIVRTHAQGALVKASLAEAGVAAVEDTGESVFDSREAGVLADFLAAMLTPDDPRLFRWTLAGPLFGLAAEDFASMKDDNFLWEEWLARAGRFRAAWDKHGFMPAFRLLDAETSLRERVAALPGGERILTNILHLAELLNAAERSGKLSAAGLAKWLSTQRADTAARPRDGHAMRLESDAKAVRVVTAHKSKGLEFPVVFMPFALDKSHKGAERFVLSRAGDGSVLWISAGEELPEEVLAANAEDELSERVRLLYVSLTRARNRCVVYLADNGVDKNAPDLALPTILGASDWASLQGKLEACAARLPQGIAVEVRRDVPLSPAPEVHDSSLPELSPRLFRRSVAKVAMLTSFSALHGDSSHAAPEAAVELPERVDEVLPSGPQADAALSGIAAFPRGAAVGTFFHACLEYMDYANPASWREVVEKQLRLAGLDAAAWLDVAHGNLTEVLQTPLAPGGPVLAGKRMRETVREAEFYLPARGVDTRRLAQAFASSGGTLAAYAEHAARLDAKAVDGYLKGYIDLVFRDGERYYILDWKSNWLGPDAAAYSPATLDAAMRSADYYLQGALYAAALRRNMAVRWPEWDYEKHFGGLYYVFLRGVDGSPGHGVVHFRPEESLLDGVEEALGMGRAGR